MYRLEKKARDHHDRFLSPSFSSSLLDQIYRSIDDDGDRKNHETKFYREIKTTVNKKQWTEPTDRKDDDSNKLRRRGEKVAVETEMDQDVLFFSSTSISSDSSFGGFSSSDTESLYGTRSSRASSSSMPKPKPVRTSASFRLDHHKPGTRMYDDDGFRRNSNAKQGTVARDEEALLIKNKSRALRIYNNLKKVKQPISPGGRLTSFLNSLFATGNGKKKKTSSSSSSKKDTCEDVNQAFSTCCSSARSCLSKTKAASFSLRDRLCNEAKLNRTVRFYPVEEEEPNFLREYRAHNQKKNDLVVLKDLKIKKHNEEDDVDGDYDDYDDDAASYASSDLFELDHLAVLGSARYCEELPVYETTHVSTNRAIANGLIV